ncbi:dipeptidyl aminopeptidase/acylaminoacyl peptidase [Sphingomonas zeicaulis]|uniref:alpha/beta hydrolase family protein n=1 Tax=Sphingomonas zeicaulis TaxID=1632740 RepID=UPI003D23EFC4
MTRSLALAILPCIALLHASTCAARSYTVDDLLQTESFGAVLADPKGRWVAFEQLVGSERAPRFDMPEAVMRSRLFLFRTDVPEAASLLLRGADADLPAILYGTSPSGDHLAIGAWRAGKWQLGIVAAGSATVRWLGVTPSYVPGITTLTWVSDDRLVAIAEQDGALPWALRIGREASDVLPARWGAMASGGPSAVTAVGSGHWRQVASIPPPQALLEVDVPTGTAREVARGRFTRLVPSPDKRRIAAVERGALVPLDPDRPVTIGTSTARHRLLIITPAKAGVSRPCAGCDVAEDSLSWSDSGDLALFARAAGKPWTQGAIWHVRRDAATAMMVRLAGIQPVVSGPPSLPFHVDLAWRQDKLLVFATPEGRQPRRNDWYQLGADGPRPLTSGVGAPSAVLARTSICATTMLAGNAAWCLDGRQPRAITPGADRIEVDSAGSVFATTTDRKTWTFIAATGEVTIAASDQCRPEIGLPAQRAAILRCADRDASSRLILMPPIGGARLVTRINEHLASVTPARRLAVHHPGETGLLTSWLYMPPAGVRPARGWPLIVIPYPGRTFGAVPSSGLELAGGWRQTNAQLLTAAGYAVLAPSMPRLPEDAPLPFAFADQIAAAIAAIPESAGIDRHSVGLWGHSFGAYAGAVTAAADHRYKAIVLASGAYDLVAAHGGFSPATRVAPEYGRSTTSLAGWAESGQPALNAPPWAAAQRYVAASPIFSADRVTAPALLIASDRDIFAVDQAEALFSALDRYDRDAMLLTYWGERHVISSPANVRNMMGQIISWFDRYLRRQPSGDRAGLLDRHGVSASASRATSVRPAASRRSARRDRSG